MGCTSGSGGVGRGTGEGVWTGDGHHAVRLVQPIRLSESIDTLTDMPPGDRCRGWCKTARQVPRSCRKQLFFTPQSHLPRRTVGDKARQTRPRGSPGWKGRFPRAQGEPQRQAELSNREGAAERGPLWFAGLRLSRVLGIGEATFKTRQLRVRSTRTKYLTSLPYSMIQETLTSNGQSPKFGDKKVSELGTLDPKSTG